MGSGDRKAYIFGDHYFANCPSFSELPSQILTENLRLLAISGDSVSPSHQDLGEAQAFSELPAEAMGVAGFSSPRALLKLLSSLCWS